MHRVFAQPSALITGPPTGLSALRAFLCSLGLAEETSGDAYLYSYPHPSGSLRRFATLHGGRRSVTIYLYPDALGRDHGYATRFYRVLDDAGLGMGSKAGPSIGIDLDDDTQVRLFHDGLRALLEKAQPST
ncbi:MAG: hypothetical protein HYX51_04350 [Chloroflexi bacterium]|nr:hypothetical protein [Chloroflexota bacterium]